MCHEVKHVSAGIRMHLQMEQHDVYPEVRLSTAQVETGLGVQAVVAFQRAGEQQLRHAASIRICVTQNGGKKTLTDVQLLRSLS